VTLWILDTDHLSLYRRGHVKLKAHLAQFLPAQVAITAITAEEQLRGRLAQIREARTEAERLQAYYWFCDTLELLKDFTVVTYDAAASTIYELLRQQKLRIGTQDLRIAAITLVLDATLVTRNQRHFGQVPNLKLVDWTK
jgi:tRNA(fMet)-specific endonuclease VapC